MSIEVPGHQKVATNFQALRFSSLMQLGCFAQETHLLAGIVALDIHSHAIRGLH